MLFAVAVGLKGLEAPVGEVMAALAAAASEDLQSPTLLSLIEAALGVGALTILVVSMPLAIFISFFAVEWLLVGRPARVRDSLFFMGVQAVLILFYMVANPWLAKVIPLGSFQPLVLIAASDLPEPAQWLANIGVYLCLLTAFSFSGYWAHRAQHEIPLLWRLHSVHHAIEHMEAVKDASHPIDVIGERVSLLLLGFLLGFDH